VHQDTYVKSNSAISRTAADTTSAPRNQAAHSNNTALTPREREILQWCALGKSSWEIAQILDICESTINFHLGNAAHKLKVRGRRASCIVALAKGIIAVAAEVGSSA
jgi:DNA-binding CsgD family transcriptional regulator